MPHEKVHVVCENLCLEEGMTKGQIEEVIGDIEENINKLSDSKFDKNNIVIINGSKTLDYDSSDYKETSWEISYPESFNKSNCVVLSFQTGMKNCFDASTNQSVGGYGEREDIIGLTGGMLPRRLSLMTDYIRAYCTNINTNQQVPIDYRIVLMKV